MRIRLFENNLLSLLLLSGFVCPLHSAMQDIADTRAGESKQNGAVTVIPFSGVVQSGESFTKGLGNGLLLTVSPNTAAQNGHSDGWSLGIISDGDNSRANLICLPLHGCNNCMIDPDCMVFSHSRNIKFHLPEKWTVEIGIGEPDYSAYSDDPKDSNWEPPTMRVPSYKKMGTLEFTIKDLKMEDVDKKSPNGGDPPAWFSQMQCEGIVKLPQ